MSTSIKVTENTSVVNFNDIPARFGGGFLSELFQNAAHAGINIDMISQAPSTADRISFGFTLSDSDMSKLLPLTSALADKYPKVTPLLNTGNIKITVHSDEMENETGFAAKVFSVLERLDIVPLLISTGVDEIALLVYESERTALETELESIF
ncbi:MAG: aspartate kinase [Oscillospiraceae bacterium]|jgi:aspartokinase|nr:aspartate kinase [Oscillospiraceae bacterium]